METEANKQSHQPPDVLSVSETARGPFPYDENVVFHGSLYFKKNKSLPSPAEVRETAARSTDYRVSNPRRSPPVFFSQLGLVVKYGTEITLAEGQCLLYIRRGLCPEVPVPEIYGWCRDGDQVFLYMELIEGITLEKSWETLTEDDRIFVCRQLRSMIGAWRGLKQDYSPQFIGSPTCACIMNGILLI
jgi:hypothetical protein